MSDVRRYTYTLESCGSCQAEFVLASVFDALATENARLREALDLIRYMAIDDDRPSGIARNDIAAVAIAALTPPASNSDTQ